ncbi:MAG: VWA domain-containing protein [Rhizobiaceae bacterium]
MPQSSRRLLRKFANDRSGNFSLMLAAGSLTILLAAGFAIDFGRMATSNSTSANAVDAAILAAARDLMLGDIEPDEAYEFVKEYIEGTLGVDVGPGHEYEITNFKIDTVNEKISVDLSRDMPMTFMALAGKKTRRNTASGSALYGIDSTEVVMTFDVTGSMRGKKINDLKTAATSGIGDLLGGSAANGKLRVAMVPYAEGVNTGPLYQTVFAEDENTSGAPPVDDPSAPAGEGSAAADNCSTERKGQGQFTDDSPRKGKINRDFRLRRCPASPLIPLSADAGLLQDAVADMTTGGGTGGHIGIQWAWYLMSPKWAEYLPAGSTPAEYGSDVRKFAVIMTDGEFNVAYAGVPKNSSQYRQSRKSMAKARKLCRNMKNQGIEIFTIGFALNNRDARELMRDCASTDTEEVAYYHEAGNGDELKKIYKDIAVSIKQLRLTR